MIGNVINLKQLEALVAVADLGSFRKAAHHLNTTQPNISARIATLESNLGVILMLRDATSVRLTDKGRAILLDARATLRQAEQLVETAGRPDIIEDRMRLGVTELIACTWLHDYLRQLKAAYPGLNIELTVDLSRKLDEEIGAGQLDLALQNAPFSSDASGHIELGDYGYRWVAGPALAKRAKTAETVADFLPFGILTHDRQTQSFLELTEYAAKHGLNPSRFIPCNSLTSSMQMAADNMGIAALPEALVSADVEKGRLAYLNHDWVPSPLRFAARFDAQKAPLFVQAAAKIAAKVATG